MKPTRFPRRIKWFYTGGGYGEDNRRLRRLERRQRGQEAREEQEDELLPEAREGQ